MTRKKTKKEIISQNSQIINETIPQYLTKIQHNNEILQEELEKWESIVPKINNPYNMQQHINKLYKELDAWRNLIPGKSNVEAARKFLAKAEESEEEKATNNFDENDMRIYNELFLEQYGSQYDLRPFGNVQSFQVAKQNAVANILNENIDPLTKTINDEYYFIKFFEMKKYQGMTDKDFDVDEIDKYTKW